MSYTYGSNFLDKKKWRSNAIYFENLSISSIFVGFLAIFCRFVGFIAISVGLYVPVWFYNPSPPPSYPIILLLSLIVGGSIKEGGLSKMGKKIGKILKPSMGGL